MVPDSPEVSDVLAGEGGVFDNAKEGTLVIDFSSIRPDVTTQLAEQAATRACVSSTRPFPAARQGGQRGAVDHGRRRGGRSRQPSPTWTWWARRRTCRLQRSCQTVKAANQLIVAANIEALAEAVVFLEAYGVDTAAALEVLGGAWPARRCWTRRSRTCSIEHSSRVSESRCTTKILASSPRRRAKRALSYHWARSSPS
jgi:2-hydroxy-3-oxopropionate reductase